MSNGLREVETVLESEAVLVASPQISPASRELLDKLAFRIDAVQRAKKSKYIALNVPVDKLEDVTRLLPGLKSPSIIPLSDPAWCSLHTVIEEDNFWEILGSLQEHGASGIVVMPMEKMVV